MCIDPEHADLRIENTQLRQANEHLQRQQEPHAWWHDHTNLVLLTRFMADDDYTADQVAYAVEKPWKHDDLWALVEQRVAEDTAFAAIVQNYHRQEQP